MTLTVLQIIPALGSGGAEQGTVDIAAALVKRGDKALIVTEGGWREETAQNVGANVILHDVATKNPAQIIKNAFWLAELIRREKVDIVHARSRAPAWSAKLASKMTGCPFVTTFHAAYKISGAAKRLYNSVMASATRVIAVSPFIATHIRENYGVPDTRLRVIDRGLDLSVLDPASIAEDRLSALRAAWKLPEGQKAIILPARLSAIKGHDTVLLALGKLKRRGLTLPPVVFVGDDQGRARYSRKLYDLVAHQGLDGVVIFAGACSDMPAAYALAQLVLQPSRVPEGFGRVPVEAMAMGVPVIASDLGAMKDTILEGQTGWLVAPEHPNDWAKAIERALSMTPEQREMMWRTARAHVAAHYTNEIMVAKTLAVYDDVAAERNQ